MAVIWVEGQTHVLYECDICSGYHPWTWDGDCREDQNRYSSPKQYASRYNLDAWEQIQVRSMTEKNNAQTDGFRAVCKFGRRAKQ